MIVLTLLQAVSGAIPKNPIARWEWVFPVVETLHIFGFTMLVGAVTILDLRLLGATLRRIPIPQLAKDLSPWIWAGIVVQFITGPYLFSGDPHEYIQIAAFRNKMLFLLLALIYHFTVIRKAVAAPADASAPLGWRRPAAFVSLGLWFCVLLSGMWIGNL